MNAIVFIEVTCDTRIRIETHGLVLKSHECEIVDTERGVRRHLVEVSGDAHGRRRRYVGYCVECDRDHLTIETTQIWTQARRACERHRRIHSTMRERETFSALASKIVTFCVITIATIVASTIVGR